MLEPNRLFFALIPDGATMEACHKAARDLGVRMQPGGKAIPPANYHLTLAFLGNRVNDKDEAAARSVAIEVKEAPFDLTLNQASSFAGTGSTWWLGPMESPPGLERLRRSLYEQLVQMRVPVDRKRFVPHVTVYRDAGMRLPPTRIPPIAWPISAFALMRSELGLAAPIYSVVEQWPLHAKEEIQAQQISLW